MSFFFFFLREFQPMTSALGNSSLSSDQDTNQFLVYAEGLNHKSLIQPYETLQFFLNKEGQ